MWWIAARGCSHERQGVRVSLSVLYYSACRIAEPFAAAVRAELVRSLQGRYPIISITHKPVDFGNVRIVVGDVTPSIVQVYFNILAGCEAADTTHCASAEDDCLYTSAHWDYRPPLDTFAYNEHRVILTRRLSADGSRREAFYAFNPRTQMAQGIFSRQLMIDTLREKCAAYPHPPLDTNIAKKAGWGEPGRYEKNLKLTPRKLERFKWTAQPNITINHGGLMGRRAIRLDMPTWDTLEPWGNADELWRRIVG